MYKNRLFVEIISSFTLSFAASCNLTVGCLIAY